MVKTKVKKRTVKENIKDARFVQNLYFEKHLKNSRYISSFRNFQILRDNPKEFSEDDKFRIYLLDLLIKVIIEFTRNSSSSNKTSNK